MVRDSNASRGQLEKYNDFIIRVKWSKDQLWTLMERRINYLFRWKYSSDNVHFNDIFLSQVDGRQSTWNYIVERTLYRPRDIINFVNFALQAAEGKSSVSKTNLLKAEHEYSDLRLSSLKFEWGTTFPGISVILDLLVGKPPYFGVSEFCTSDLVTRLYDKIGETPEGQADPLWQRLHNGLGANATALEPIAVAQEVFHRLHLIGAVGLKISSSASWQWVYESGRPVQNHSIDTSTKVEIHPMLHFALHNVDRSKHSE